MMREGDMNRPCDDEIDLRDLARTLIRRKWVVFGVAALCTVLALAVWATRSQSYVCATLVGIGQTFAPDGVADGETAPVLKADTVVARLRAEIIPRALDQRAEADPNSVGIQVDAAAENARTVLLTSRGSAGNEEMYRALHLAVFEVMRADLAAEERRAREAAALALSGKLRQVDHLALETEQIEFQIKNTEAEQRVLTAQLETLDQQIAMLKPFSSAAIGPSREGEGMVLTRMSLINEMLGYEKLHADISFRLAVTIPSKVQQLHSSLAKNALALEKAKAEQALTALKLEQLEHLPPTRIITGPKMSPDASGRGLKVYLALGLAAGLMLGVFGAFFTEFAAGLREEKKA